MLGGGTAGMAAARTARRRGVAVVLVQAGPVGGDCTFTGCIPSKTLIEAAASGLGPAAALARVRATVAGVAAGETADVLRAEGIEVVEGTGRFLSPGVVAVGDVVLRAPAVVVATGSAPAVPAVAGIDDVGVLTNESVFGLGTAPASLVVLGAGPVGVELAQAFARLGTTVTLVESAARVLPGEEPEASAVVAAALAADGVAVRTATTVASLHPDPAGVRVALAAGGGDVVAAALLVATGRRAVTADLDLAAAGVACDGRGYIVTDGRLRTTAAGTFAAGDVTGRRQLTHAADEMGRVAATNALARVPLRRYRDRWIPAVTFTDPEVARVGLTEGEASALPGTRVAYLPMTEVDRAVTAGRTEGYVKLVVGPRRATRHLAGGRLLGATVVAPRAGEMIHAATLVARAGMFPARLAVTTQAYPTWSTALQQAAAQLFMVSGGRSARPARSDPGSATIGGSTPPP